MKSNRLIVFLCLLLALSFASFVFIPLFDNFGGEEFSSNVNNSDFPGADSSDVESVESDVPDHESSDVGFDESDVPGDESSDVGSDESDVPGHESSDVVFDESDVPGDESSDIYTDLSGHPIPDFDPDVAEGMDCNVSFFSKSNWCYMLYIRYTNSQGEAVTVEKESTYENNMTDNEHFTSTKFVLEDVHSDIYFYYSGGGVGVTVDGQVYAGALDNEPYILDVSFISENCEILVMVQYF